MTRMTSVGIALALAAGLASAASAQFYAGKLVVSQVGLDGSTTALTNAATAARLKEFSIVGAATGTVVDLPVAVSGANLRVTNSGTATSEGQLSLSADGSRLVFAGYDAAVGTTGVASSQASVTARVLAAINLENLAVDSSTGFGDAGNNNVRSGVLSGTRAIITTGNGGVREQVLGTNNAATTLLSGPTTTPGVGNYRVANFFGGNLYASSGSGAALGLNVITGSGFTNLIATGTGSSPYDFIVASATPGSGLVYIADDRTTSAGGLQVWTNTGSAWTLSSTINVAGLSAGTFAGLRSLTQDPATSLFYGITTDNRLVLIDAGSGAVQTLATAPANTAFRGVEFIIPAPGTAMLLGLGGLIAARRRR